MAETVSTFLFAGGGPYRYAFLLVSTNSYADAVRDEVARQAEAFGADLGPEGVLIRANPQRMYDTAEEVLAKRWPEAVRERLEFEADPFILVIDRRFGSFDPQQHPYAIIWLADYHSDPGAVRPLLQLLARKTRQREDVIGYLRDVAERTRRAETLEDVGENVGTVARLASYVEIRPNLFGVSIDLKAILRDIAASR